MGNERGIILGPDVYVNVKTNYMFFRTTDPNSGLLRHAVLYWDKIDFPQNNIIHIESNDINFLKQSSQLQHYPAK